ncbi:MAG: small subunit ribosomal protein S16 [Parcubacteria group bacterium Gr01-1014_33]|nr:MAG: small subunit ribosomal protein S16 [Parcubacteria group bacterium Gr01-1014_33]
MLVIRFQRIGRKNDPAYRVVVTEKRSRPKSGGVEILGSYHPKTKQVVLKNDRILHWMARGAKVSDTVHNLLVAKAVIKAKKRSIKGQAAKKIEKKEALPSETAHTPA